MLKTKLTGLFFLLLPALYTSGQRHATNVNAHTLKPAPGGITDLALIYQGGTQRLPWTREQLRPYVYRDAGNGPEWLFDGFLFIEFKDNLGHLYAEGYGEKPAGKKEWEWLLDRNFEKDRALHALDGILDSLARSNLRPARKRKVVLTLPEPISGFTAWGALDKKNMNFNNAADKIAACKWFVSTALARWKAARFRHIELAGFYWVAEQNTGAEAILPALGDYIRSRHLQFYWIPYYGAAGAGKWQEMGFDIAYQQPNYFFETKTPYNILTGAMDYAREHHMALEMEFDSRVVSDAAFRERYDAYVEEFRKQGVWEQLPVAYYEGGHGWLDMYRSGDTAVQRLYNKLADIIVKRQLATDKRLCK